MKVIKNCKIFHHDNGLSNFNQDIIYDEHKNFEKWFTKNKCKAVLIRPDRYVFDTYKNIEVRNIILDISRTIKL